MNFLHPSPNGLTHKIVRVNLKGFIDSFPPPPGPGQCLAAFTNLFTASKLLEGNDFYFQLPILNIVLRAECAHSKYLLYEWWKTGTMEG